MEMIYTVWYAYIRLVMLHIMHTIGVCRYPVCHYHAKTAEGHHRHREAIIAIAITRYKFDN